MGKVFGGGDDKAAKAAAAAERARKQQEENIRRIQESNDAAMQVAEVNPGGADLPDTVMDDMRRRKKGVTTQASQALGIL
jgi:hypothetical protein